MKRLWIIIWCVGVTSISIGQQLLIGKVVNLDGLPITDVSIVESIYGETFYTDSLGRFSISVNPSVKQLSLLFIDNNYHLLQKEVDLNTVQDLLITLQTLSVELDAVTISERRKYIYGFRNLREKEGTTLYAGKKTEVVLLDNKISNLAIAPPRQVYNQITGVNVFESNDGGIQLNIGLRGLDPNRSSNINIRQNSYDISADVLGYPESYYTPPVESLDEIQVIKGAASLQFGTQFGGLVNFKTKQPSKKKIDILSHQTVGSFGLFSSYNQISGSAGKFKYLSFFNYKKGSGFRPNSAFDASTLFSKLGYQFSKNSSITGEITKMQYKAQQPGGLTDAQFYADPNFSNRSRNFFAVDWLLYNARWDHKINANLEFSISFAGLNANRDAIGFRTNRVSQADTEATPRELLLGEFNNNSLEGKLIQQWNFQSRPSYILLGFKWYNAENASYQGPGTTGSADDFYRTEDLTYPFSSDFLFPNKNLAFFSEFTIPLSSKLTFTPGFRLEKITTVSNGSFSRTDFDLAGNVINSQLFQDNQQFSRKFILFGLGATYKTSSQRQWYANLSENYRSVTFSDLRIVNPTFQVDPNIQDESGYTFDLGYRGAINSSWNFDVGLFGLNYEDRIGEILQSERRINAEGIEVSTGRIVRYRSNLGNAFIYGIEANIEQRLKTTEKNDWNLTWYMNTAITQSQYTSSLLNNVEGNQVEFVPLLNSKMGIQLGKKNTQGGLQFTFVSSQFTDATNAPQNKVDNQRGIEGSIPAYGVMDLFFRQQFKIFSVSAGINNLLNHSYFTRRATGYPGPGIIPSEPRSFYVTFSIQP